MEQLRHGLTAYRSTGTELIRPYFLGLLAEAYGSSGRADAGLEVLAEALALVDTTVERFHEAELYRLKGELLLLSEVRRPESKGRNPQLAIHNLQLAEAETCFQHALAIAQHQQAKSLELRASMDLSRLWQQQGKSDQARRLLGEVYGWFTEGFDTGDLQEAKALLDELQ
jgi:predicted ATPase